MYLEYCAKFISDLRLQEDNILNLITDGISSNQLFILEWLNETKLLFII